MMNMTNFFQDISKLSNIKKEFCESIINLLDIKKITEHGKKFKCLKLIL